MVIIDPLQQVNEPQAQVALQKQSPIELGNQEPVYEQEVVAPEGQVCLFAKSLLKLQQIADVYEQVGFADHFGRSSHHHPRPGHRCRKVHLPANAPNAQRE